MGKDKEIEMRENEYRNAALDFQAEASKVVLHAFNEGYLMGKRHAEYLYGKGAEHED